MTQKFSEEVADGVVISVKPKEGTIVDSGSRVALVVSKGPPPVTVPNLIDMPRGKAESTLRTPGPARERRRGRLQPAQPGHQPGPVPRHRDPQGQHGHDPHHLTYPVSPGHRDQSAIRTPAHPVFADFSRSARPFGAHLTDDRDRRPPRPVRRRAAGGAAGHRGHHPARPARRRRGHLVRHADVQGRRREGHRRDRARRVHEPQQPVPLQRPRAERARGRPRPRTRAPRARSTSTATARSRRPCSSGSCKVRIAEINAGYPKKSGESREFYDNGFLKASGKVKDGELHGAVALVPPRRDDPAVRVLPRGRADRRVGHVRHARSSPTRSRASTDQGPIRPRACAARSPTYP